MDTPKAAAWVVRKIIEAKRDLVQVNSMQANLNIALADMVKQGRFQIQKAYIQMLPQYPKVSQKSLHMHTQVHPRFKFHLWLVIHQRLATVDRLLKFGIQVPQDCILCARSVETLNHLFFDYSNTSLVWGKILRLFGITRKIGCWQNEIE